MPPIQECQSQWVAAIATISNGMVAAVVAIAVAWMAHRFASRRDEKKAEADRADARKTLIRDKLETLVSLIDEHFSSRQKHAMDIVTMGVLAGHGQPLPATSSGAGPSAWDQASAIAGLYFPQLATEMFDLNSATLMHMKFMSNEISQIRADSRAWSQGPADNFVERSSAADAALIKARIKLVQRARKMIEGEVAP